MTRLTLSHQQLETLKIKATSNGMVKKEMGSPSCSEDEENAAALLSKRMQLPPVGAHRSDCTDVSTQASNPQQNQKQKPQQQLQQQQQQQQHNMSMPIQMQMKMQMQQQQQTTPLSPGKRKLPESDENNAQASSNTSTPTGTSSDSIGVENKQKKLRATMSSGSASNAALSTISVGKCPPRDMKRLKQHIAYKVTRVAKWGEKLAVFLTNPEDARDSGFYKPPEAYRDHIFHVGDMITLESVGYSQSRNRVARKIGIDTSNSVCMTTCERRYGIDGGCCSRSVVSAAGADQDGNGLVNPQPQSRSSSPQSVSSNANALRGAAGLPTPMHASLAQFQNGVKAMQSQHAQHLNNNGNGNMGPAAVSSAASLAASKAASITAFLQHFMGSPTSPTSSVSSTLTATAPSPTSSPVPAIGSANFAHALGNMPPSAMNEMLLASILNMQQQQQQQQQGQPPAHGPGPRR
mmetsp:Transcript_10518/g.18571  ORF Transcript_10518/g.18571 Transcript_10518/m.18571 type:complete len:463 (+) Transcript_10518:641-2029(+)